MTVPSAVDNGVGATNNSRGFDVIVIDPTAVLADSPDIPMASAGDKDPTVDVADSPVKPTE